MASSKITLIIEKPNADDDRTTRTPGRPCRLTVSGYVTWSSTSCGERPDQSVKTMTWLSERSGIASIGVVSSAQYPQPPRSRKKATTRNRLRSETSMSRSIIEDASPRRPRMRLPPEAADRHPDEDDQACEQPEAQDRREDAGDHHAGSAHLHHHVRLPRWHWRRGRAQTRYQRPEATQRAKSVPEN